jgi:hypothetical protein
MLSESLVRLRLASAIPLPHHALPAGCLTCPICFDPYISNRSLTPSTTPRAIGKNPVRIRPQRPGARCRHVFCKTCIERHFRSGGPWCNKCPTCREVWFDDDGDDNVQSWRVDAEAEARDDLDSDNETIVRWPSDRDVGRADGQANAHAQAQVGVRIQIPRRYFVRVAQDPPAIPQAQSRSTETESSDRVEGVDSTTSLSAYLKNVEGLTSRGKVQRSVDFLEQMLLTEDVDDGDDETLQRVQDVEAAIEKLWWKLECNGLMKDYRQTEVRRAAIGAG